jgi:hypothetical protein
LNHRRANIFERALAAKGQRLGSGGEEFKEAISFIFDLSI